MIKPTKLLLALAIAAAVGTAHADELDEVTMSVINETDVTAEDATQTIDLPTAEELQLRIRERTGQDNGNGEMVRARLESEQQMTREQNREELEEAKQEMKQEMNQEMEQERQRLQESLQDSDMNSPQGR